MGSGRSVWCYMPSLIWVAWSCCFLAVPFCFVLYRECFFRSFACAFVVGRGCSGVWWFRGCFVFRARISLVCAVLGDGFDCEGVVFVPVSLRLVVCWVLGQAFAPCTVHMRVSRALVLCLGAGI